MEIPGYLLRHQVTVQPQLGEGSAGDVYGGAVPVRCFRDERRRMVRNPQGQEVVSEVTLLCRLRYANVFTPDAKVLLDDGREVFVMQVSRRDDSGLGAWQHLEVVC
jgi:hypothetical protein